ncbi:oligopeptide/dipeptide ABC transporter ATP-binding protein [Bradyrhizobium sp. 188]|uniref:oligopeptide/dipeptide ABC transporter ATP-binding protein n=1 Tax=Bradyrhizobium sp. 188 TaxID=2782656 RepID=UPI003211C8CA
MEIGPSDRVFLGPKHPYTEALISAVPNLHGTQKNRIRLSGEVPSAVPIWRLRLPKSMHT